MLSSRGRTLTLVAALALAACSSPVLAYQPGIMKVPASAAKPGKRGLFNDMVLPSGNSIYGRKGAGISMAQQKRASAKKRGIARNRKHHH